MKAVDLLDEPVWLGFKFRMPSGEYHTFILTFDSNREFLKRTKRLPDRAKISVAFARAEEFPAAVISSAIVVNEARKRRIEYLKKQK